MRQVNVEDLVSVARLPVHFWGPIKGGKKPSENPGQHITSFAVFNLAQETVILPTELEASLDECILFSRTIEGLTMIFNWLASEAGSIVESVNKIHVNEQQKLGAELNELMMLVTTVKTTFNNLVTTGVDFESSLVKVLRHQFIICAKLLELLQAKLNKLLPPSIPEPA